MLKDFSFGAVVNIAVGVAVAIVVVAGICWATGCKMTATKTA